MWFIPVPVVPHCRYATDSCNDGKNWIDELHDWSPSIDDVCTEIRCYFTCVICHWGHEHREAIRHHQQRSQENVTLFHCSSCLFVVLVFDIYYIYYFNNCKIFLIYFIYCILSSSLSSSPLWLLWPCCISCCSLLSFCCPLCLLSLPSL